MVLVAVSAGLVIASSAFAAISAGDRISPDGPGRVTVGMTIDEASAALGAQLDVNRDAGDGTCFGARPLGSGRGISFLGTGDRIARAHVFGRSRIRTPEGAGVGTTERGVRSLYPGRVRASRHQYVRGGRYLTVTGYESGRLLIFETNARRRVTALRAGALPEVGYIEGCS